MSDTTKKASEAPDPTALAAERKAARRKARGDRVEQRRQQAEARTSTERG